MSCKGGESKAFSAHTPNLLFYNYIFELTQTIQLTAGTYAAKASRHLPGHLCERLNDPAKIQDIFSACR